MQEFADPVNNVVWHYRQGGNSDSEEAVVIFPTIYETTNTMFLFASEMIKQGFRVIVVSIPPCETLTSFLNGFDLFTAKMRICDLHLIGFGFGGFLCLHVVSFNQLSANVCSLILINSYMNTKMFAKSSSILSILTGKSRLSDELGVERVPVELRQYVEFVLSEVDSMPQGVAAARIKLRAKSPAAVAPEIPENSVLMIQCLDWASQLSGDAVPQANIKGQKVALLKSGGVVPHLASCEKLMEYVNMHLSRLRKSAQ